MIFTTTCNSVLLLFLSISLSVCPGQSFTPAQPKPAVTKLAAATTMVPWNIAPFPYQMEPPAATGVVLEDEAAEWAALQAYQMEPPATTGAVLEDEAAEWAALQAYQMEPPAATSSVILEDEAAEWVALQAMKTELEVRRAKKIEDRSADWIAAEFEEKQPPKFEGFKTRAASVFQTLGHCALGGRNAFASGMCKHL